MKLINAILGVFAVFGAIFVIFIPELTVLNAGWIIAFLIGVWGLCAIIMCAMGRKQNIEDKAVKTKGIVGLIIGILALVASILSMTTTLTGALFLLIILIMFTAWMLIDGIVSVVSASKRKKTGERYKISLVFGIILIVSGALAVICWAIAAQEVKIYIGIALAVFGVRLVFAAFDRDKLSEDSSVW